MVPQPNTTNYIVSHFYKVNFEKVFIFLFKKIHIPTVSSEELTVPLSAGCDFSRLRCNGHSILLATYIHGIGCAATEVRKHRAIFISCQNVLI